MVISVAHRDLVPGDKQFDKLWLRALSMHDLKIYDRVQRHAQTVETGRRVMDVRLVVQVGEEALASSLGSSSYGVA